MHTSVFWPRIPADIRVVSWSTSRCFGYMSEAHPGPPFGGLCGIKYLRPWSSGKLQDPTRCQNLWVFNRFPTPARIPGHNIGMPKIENMPVVTYDDCNLPGVYGLTARLQAFDSGSSRRKSGQHENLIIGRISHVRNG